MSAPQKRHQYADVFDWIVKYKREHDGNSPTMREIQDGCSIPSTSTVSYILIRLEEQNLITLTDPIGRSRSRSICVIGGHWSFTG